MCKTLAVLLVISMSISFALAYQPLSKTEAMDTKLSNQPIPVIPKTQHPDIISTKTTLLSENFSNVTFPPTGWNVIQTNTGTQGSYPCYWSRFTEPGYAVRTEPASAGLWWSYAKQEEWLITPEVILTGSATNNYYLRYWYYGYCGSPDSDHYYTKITTDGGSTWTTLYDLSEHADGWNRYNEPVLIDLSAYAGQTIKIAWYAEDGPADHGITYVWFIDDVEIGYPFIDDVGVSNLLAINSIPLVVGDPDTFYIRLGNFGTNAQIDVPVMMTANGDEVDSLVATIPALGYFDTMLVWTPVSNGDYTLKFFTQLSTDQDMFNDTVQKCITVCPEFHSIPYFKDFDEDWGPFGNNPPFCGWEIIDNGDESIPRWNRNDWFHGNINIPARSVATVRYSPKEHQDEWLISPRLDCSIDTSYTLSFWHQYEGYRYAQPDTGYVLCSTDGGATWTEITRYSGGVSGLVSYGYQTLDITSLVSGQSNVRIAFRYYAYNAGKWQLDDFAVMYTPSFDAEPIAIDIAGLDGINDTFDVNVTVKNAGISQLLANWYVYFQLRDNLDSALVDAALNPGDTRVLTFQAIVTEADTYTLNAWTAYPGDEYPLNDLLSRKMSVTGWLEMAWMPYQTTREKGIKDGGALETYNGLVYAFRGANSTEFYAYDPVNDTWYIKADIPFGLKLDSSGIMKKKVKAGGALTLYNDKIYAFKGGNTWEFWAYNPANDSWMRKADITDLWPGASKKRKIKAGGALVAYEDSIYAFKGGNTREFWMYIPASDAWVARCSLLTVDSRRIKAGAALEKLGDLIYAFVGGNTNHFYAYSPATNTWTQKADPSFDPRLNARAKKKVKDGGALAELDGKIYAFKGGNLNHFGYYDAVADTWYTLEVIPGPKKVKGGGALAACNGIIYATKGKNRREFWSYTPWAETPVMKSSNSYISSQSNDLKPRNISSEFTLDASPNPFTSRTTIRYSVPVSGKVLLKLYNTSGRLVNTFNDGYLEQGTYAFNLSNTKLVKGVYFLRCEYNNNKAEIKIINL
jgi:hypothetical protein